MLKQTFDEAVRTVAVSSDTKITHAVTSVSHKVLFLKATRRNMLLHIVLTRTSLGAIYQYLIAIPQYFKCVLRPSVRTTDQTLDDSYKS